MRMFSKSLLTAFLFTAWSSVAPAQIATDPVAAATAFGTAIGATKVDDHTYTSDWLGTDRFDTGTLGIYYTQTDFPWIYIVNSGTFLVSGQYVAETNTFLGASDSGLFLFERSLGRLYTSRATYPWFYAYKLPKKKGRGWILLSGDGPPRRLYVYNRRKWTTY